MLPENIQGWVGLVGAVFGLIALLAAIAAYFRVNLSNATINTLKESNAAYREREHQRDERDRERDAQMLAMSAKLESLERENTTLRELVSGKADVQNIFDLIKQHHESIMSDRKLFDDKWTAGMTDLGSRMDVVRKSIDDVLIIVGHGREADKVMSS